MANSAIVELTRNSKNYAKMVEEMVKVERKVFPKHESLARSFDEEVRKKNTGVLYSHIEGGGDLLIGYVMYSFPSSLLASITKLAVKEKYRRQGHGEALLRAAIERCKTRHIQRIYLHVDPLRTSAVSLYQKVGFQIEELIECYYSSDRNAYRMYLDFSDE